MGQFPDEMEETRLCEQEMSWGALLGRTPVRDEGRWYRQRGGLDHAVDVAVVGISGGFHS